MNLYFHDMKNIDILQAAQKTVNTYILLRKNQEYLSFLSARTTDILEGLGDNDIVETSYVVNTLEMADRELDDLVDQLHFHSREMLVEICEDPCLQIYCFNKIYEYDDFRSLIESSLANVKEVDLVDNWSKFMERLEYTYEKELHAPTIERSVFGRK